MDRCAHLVGCRINARDRALRRVGEPDGAFAGGGRLAGSNLDPGDDGVSPRVDPHQRRLDVAHRPDRPLADREGTPAQRSWRAATQRNPGDDLASSGQCMRVGRRRLSIRRRDCARLRSRRGRANPRQRARSEATDPDGTPRRRDRESGRSFRRWGDPDRRARRLPRAHVDPANAPVDCVADEQVAAGPREPRGLATDSNRVADRLKRPRVETPDLASIAVDEPDTARCDRDPDREAADMGASDRTRSGIDA